MAGSLIAGKKNRKKRVGRILQTIWLSLKHEERKKEKSNYERKNTVEKYD